MPDGVLLENGQAVERARDAMLFDCDAVVETLARFYVRNRSMYFRHRLFAALSDLIDGTTKGKQAAIARDIFAAVDAEECLLRINT